MENLYLPSKSDWKTWFKIRQKLGVEFSNRAEFGFIHPDDFRVIVCLIRQLLDERPPLREELIDQLKHDSLQCIAEYVDMFRDLRKDSRDRSIARYLRDLSLPSGGEVLSIISMNDWRKNYGSPDKDIHGSAALYKITAKGTLTYEMGLTLPCLSMDLRGLKSEYTIADFIINFGILNRRIRLQWRRSFLEKHKFRIGKFHEDIFADISSFLGASEELFWNMTNPATLLLYEHAGILKILDRNKREISDLKIEEKTNFKTSKKQDQWPRYEIEGEDNLMESFKALQGIATMYLKELIRPKWTQLGLALNDLERHSPEVSW